MCFSYLQELRYFFVSFMLLWPWKSIFKRSRPSKIQSRRLIASKETMKSSKSLKWWSLKHWSDRKPSKTRNEAWMLPPKTLRKVKSRRKRVKTAKMTVVSQIQVHFCRGTQISLLWKDQPLSVPLRMLLLTRNQILQTRNSNLAPSKSRLPWPRFKSSNRHFRPLWLLRDKLASSSCHLKMWLWWTKSSSSSYNSSPPKCQWTTLTVFQCWVNSPSLIHSQIMR